MTQRSKVAGSRTPAACAALVVLAGIITISCGDNHVERGRVETIAARFSLKLDAPAPALKDISADRDHGHCGHEVSNHALVASHGRLSNAVITIPWSPNEGSLPSHKPDRNLMAAGCLFKPRVQVARVGDSLLMSKTDPITHNPHAWKGGVTQFNVTMVQSGQSIRRRLENQGMVELQCDTHRWMRAFIYVCSEGEQAQVTDREGTASFSAVPVGRHRLSVWHELAGTREIEIEITPDQTEYELEIPVNDSFRAAAAGSHEVIGIEPGR